MNVDWSGVSDEGKGVMVKVVTVMIVYSGKRGLRYL